jgi:hypothetical protein
MSKIAILVNDRQGEALRMSSGITMLDDEIELIFLDNVLDGKEDTEMMMEIINEMELPMYTNKQENEQMTLMSTEDLQNKLLEYDHIISY